MMDFQLTLPHILKRAETYFGDGEIVTRLPDKSFHRTNYRETMRRAKPLLFAVERPGPPRRGLAGTLRLDHSHDHEVHFCVPPRGVLAATPNPARPTQHPPEHAPR